MLARAGIAGPAVMFLVLKLIIKVTEGERSSIDLPEHDVKRADDRRDVCKHVAAAQEVHRL
jgi:hypothetical protein